MAENAADRVEAGIAELSNAPVCQRLIPLALSPAEDVSTAAANLLAGVFEATPQSGNGHA